MAPFGASRAGLMSVTGDDIPDSGLDHQWNYDVESDTVEDTIGNLDIDFNGDGTWQTDAGAGGIYLDLDGVDDYGVIPNSDEQFGHWTEDGNGTIMGWFYPDEDQFAQLYSTGAFSAVDSAAFSTKLRDNGNYDMEVRDSNGDVVVQIQTDGYVIDEWNFFAFVSDENANEARLYDAVVTDSETTEIGSDSGVATNEGATHDDDLFVGRRPDASGGGDFFDGGLDLAAEGSQVLDKSAIDDFFADSKGFYE